MLKELVHSKGVGGNEEHWYYLVFDEDNGSFFIEYERDYQGWGNHAHDTESVPLADAKGQFPIAYENAVKIIKQKLFSQ